jgi:hypothetical protein
MGSSPSDRYYQLVSKGVSRTPTGANHGNHLTTKGSRAIPDASRIGPDTLSGALPKYDILEQESAEDALKSWFEYALNPRVSTEYDIKVEGQEY